MCERERERIAHCKCVCVRERDLCSLIRPPLLAGGVCVYICVGYCRCVCIYVLVIVGVCV